MTALLEAHSLELEIGEAGEAGVYVFQLMVATPENLRAHHKGEALQAYTSMCGRVASCERSTWVESLNRLRAKFCWEYEGTGYVSY